MLPNSDHMVAQQQVKCYFCNAPTDKVCYDPICVLFPFICSTSCHKNDETSRKVHTHGQDKEQRLFPIEKMDQIIVSIRDKGS